MSKITLAPDVSGSGTFTLAAPNSNVDRTLTLPDNSGTVQTELTNGFGFRNRIINGGMVIDQRNAGAAVTPTGNGFTLDRWAFNIDQPSKASVQRNAGAVTPPVGFTNYLGVTSLSAYTVGAAEAFALQQIVEGFNISDLGWGTASAQTITVSFWVRSSLTGTFGGSLSNSAVNRSYPFNYVVSAANTWEYKTITIPGDTTGTWLTDNGAGIRLYFGLGAGASASGSAGAWASGFFRSATGAVSVVGTNGATFYITGVQLEAGSVATPFERRPYGTEFALCQRYFQFWGAGAVGRCANDNFVEANGKLSGQMRASPTIALPAPTPVTLPGIGNRTMTGVTGSLSNTGGQFGMNISSGSTGALAFTVGSPFTASAEL